MSLRVLFPGFLALGVALMIISTAQAQFPPRNRNQGMQAQRIKISGTLVSTTQNQIQLSTNTNQTIYVMIGSDTEVSVTGAAEQDYLKSGVVVEFVADLDKTHTVKEPITTLTVITPTTDRPIGLSPPDSTNSQNRAKKGDKANPWGAGPGPGPGAGPGPGPGSGPGPGPGPGPGSGPGPGPGEGPRGARGNAGPDPQGGDLFAGPTAKTGKAPGGALKPPGTFTVRGTIKMCKDGKLTVAAGRGPTIKATLANGVKIDVDLAEIRFAQRDDKVTVNGITTQARPDTVMAGSIAIELANPLSGGKKHLNRAAKTPAAHPSKAKKEAADGDDLLGGTK